MATQIQLRRDTSSNWASANPTLAAGEFGWESDTNKFKIGTGSAAWNALGYASSGDEAGITFVGDDSSGTLVNQNETFKITGTQNITAVVSGDTLTLTGPDISGLAQSSSLATVATSGSYTDLTSKPTIPTNNTELTNGAGYITDYTVTQGDVTAQQAALSITESQISDLGTYLTAETNDLSAAVTWANVPNTNITESSVTQHQAALSVTESQVSDLGSYITASSTDTLTNKSGAISQFTNDSGYKTSVSEADVTAHESALSITESQISDLAHFSGSYTDLSNKPTIPTNNTELTNGAGFATTSYVDTEVAGIVDTAPEALNTLNELAAALGDDANFATTTSTALGNRLRVDTNAQGLTATQKTNAATNLGLNAVATSGAYTDLSGTPTIPTNNNQLSNGAGYITGYTVTESDVTGHQAALSVTESQISDLGSYITASSTDTLTNKSGAISQFTNDSAYLTSFTETNDLSSAVTWANVPDANITQGSVTQHQAALSITESQISDFGTYLTAEGNDLSSAVTWANVPNANITESSVTQHQAALSVTESQVSDLGSYITDYTVTESDVTGHQAALSITESQVSDLGSYITDANITIVGDDSTGITFSAKDNDNIKIAGGTNITTAVSGDTITVTGPDLTSYATQSYVNTQVANTVDSAPETLNTLNELAAALGDDANFATTTATSLGNRLRIDVNNQGLDSTQKTNAATNLGLNTVATSGAYSDLSGTPTIPTNNNTLTNGAGYITDYTVTQSDVTAQQAALSITKSQVSDFGTYLTAESNDLSSAVTWANVPDANITQGSVTQHQAALSITESQISDLSHFSGSYTDLTNKPTIPTAITGLGITDGTNGQVLTTDGAAGFTFTTVAGGGSAITVQDEGSSLSTAATTINFVGSGVVASGTGATKTITIAGGGSASTGDFTFTGNEISTSSSNADFEISTSGTGMIVLKGGGGDFSNHSTNARYNNGNILYREARDFTFDHGRLYGNAIITDIKATSGQDSNSSDDRYRNFFVMKFDANGSNTTNTSNYISRGPMAVSAESNPVNTSSSDSVIGNAQGVQGGVYMQAKGTGDLTVTEAAGMSAWVDVQSGSGNTASLGTGHGFYSRGIGTYGQGTHTVGDFYHFYAYNNDSANVTGDTYAFYSDSDSAMSRLGRIEKFNEHSYNSTVSANGAYTVDWANGNLQTVTLGANITGFTMSNFPTNTAQSVGVTLYLVQDGTGSRTMSFTATGGETFKFASGVDSSSVSAANDIQTVYIFSRYNGSSNTFYWTLGPTYS